MDFTARLRNLDTFLTPKSKSWSSVLTAQGNTIKHIVKILSLLVAISAIWIALLQTSVVPPNYTWLVRLDPFPKTCSKVMPIYLVISLGCYGLLMVGVGLMQFPTCPQEAILLQQDIVEVKEFLKQKGVDVGSD